MMNDPTRYPSANDGRFIEELNSSAPYHLKHPDSPEVVEYDAGPTGQAGPPPWTKAEPVSPEAMSPGLESIWDEEGQKEVVPPQPWTQQPDIMPDIPGYGWEGERKGRTYCGLSKPRSLLVLAVGVIIILGIALGVGLGVGIGQSKTYATIPGRSNIWLT